MTRIHATAHHTAPLRRTNERSAPVLAITSIVAGVAVGIVFATAVRFRIREIPDESFLRVASQQALFFGGWGALVVPLWNLIGGVESVRSRALKVLAFIALGIDAWSTHASFLYFTSANAAAASRTTAALARYILATAYFECVVYVAIASTIVGVRNQRRAEAQ